MKRKRTISKDPAVSSIVGSDFALRSLQQFRNSLGSGRFENMVDALNNIFRSVGKEFFWAQLFLFDHNGIISFALTNPEDPNTPSGRSIQDLRTQLIGFQIRGYPILESLSKEFAGQSVYFKEVDTNNPSDESIEEENKAFVKYYDLYLINLSAVEKNEILGVKIGEHQPVPTFIDTSKHPSMAPWLANMVVTGSYWPTLGDLPEMSGIVLFPLDPKTQVEAGEFDVEETLFMRMMDIQSFAWLISYVAFVFQTYALSQATIDEPQRLRDYLAREGWIEMLMRATKTKSDTELSKIMADVLTLERSVVTRGVLRSYFKANRTKKKEFQRWIRRVYVNNFLQSQHNVAYLQSALLHLKVLFADIDSSFADEIQSELIWPNLKERLSKLDPDTSPYVFSALCDLILVAPQERLRSIAKVLLPIYIDSINNQSFETKLLNPLVLLISRLELKSTHLMSKLAKLFIQAYPLVVGEQVDNLFEELIKRAYAFFPQETQSQVYVEFKDAHNVSDSVAKSFFNINEIGKSTHSVIDYRALFEPNEHLPGLKLLTFASHKGGVGKSLLSVAVASALGENHKVALVDLDLFGPTMFHLFGGSNKSPNNKFLNGLLFEITSSQFHPTSKSAWDRLSEYGWETSNKNLTIFPCSPFREDQDLVSRLVVSSKGVQSLTLGLFKLAQALYNLGYEYAIFDTPTELKDVTLSAVSLSSVYGGFNVFVSTLYDPAIQPFFEGMPLEYCQPNNILLVNKLRYFDKQYAQNRASLLDMIGTRYRVLSTAHGSSFISEALLERAFSLEQCFPIGWHEELERFLSSSKEFYHEDLSTVNVAKLLRQDLLPVIKLLINK